MLPAFFDPHPSTSYRPLHLVALTGFLIAVATLLRYSPARDRWLVDPLSGDGLVEDVDGVLVVFGDDVGMVFVSASGHWRVDACLVAGCVDEEEGGVDGTALGGVACLGVAEPDIGRDVFGGESDGSGLASDRDTPVGVDVGDGPVVSVLDHVSLVGLEATVVASSYYFVSNM